MADNNNKTSMLQSAGQISEDLSRRQMPKANAFVEPMAVTAPSAVIPTTLPPVETGSATATPPATAIQQPQQPSGGASSSSGQSPVNQPAKPLQPIRSGGNQASQSQQNTQQNNTQQPTNTRSVPPQEGKGVQQPPTATAPTTTAAPAASPVASTPAFAGGDVKRQPESKDRPDAFRGRQMESLTGVGEYGGGEPFIPAANLDFVNAFRAQQGLKPVRVASQAEREKAAQWKYEGESKVKAQMDEAQRKANKKTWRDWLFGSKTDEEWNKKRKEKIAAVGDFLKNLGNLYGTVNGAPSMKFDSAYDKVKAEHAKAAATKAAADKVAKDRAFKQKEADRQYSLSLGGLNIKQNADKRAQDKHPYELAKEVSDAAKAKAQAETERGMQESKIREAAGKADLAGEKVKGQQAQTALAQSRQRKADEEAKYVAPLANAEIQQRKASAANSYASAKAQKAREAQIRQNIRNNGDVTVSSQDPDKNWVVPKKDVKVLGREMQGIAKKKRWGKDLVNFDGTLKKGASAEDLLVAAFEHIDDLDVQKAIGRRGKLVKATTSSKNPVFTTLK